MWTASWWALLHFEAEINQAFQVLETRLPLSDYILAHNTFRSGYSFVPDAFWGWETRCVLSVGSGRMPFFLAGFNIFKTGLHNFNPLLARPCIAHSTRIFTAASR